MTDRQHIDPTQRFTSRVRNYEQYRPGYPADIVDLLSRECGLTPQWVVADVGSGTGLLTEVFLDNGNIVYGVEPNREMREAGERRLSGRAGFHSVDARSEETTLGDSSVDIVTAGQAFHWFDPEPTRREFERILRPDGWIALVWNERNLGSPFMEDFRMLRRAYEPSDRPMVEDDVIRAFLGPAMRTGVLANKQVLSEDGLLGRVLSSSQMPEDGDPATETLSREVHTLFATHAVDGLVTILYDTRVYFAQVSVL